MSERKRTIEVRGIPPRTAFMGSINGMVGLWWRDESGVYALDVRDVTGTHRVSFTRKPTNQYPYHATDKHEVVDYVGPVDIQIRVKGFSPWRGKQRDIGPSHVEVKYEREDKFRKGPRKVRLRDDLHLDAEVV